MFLVLKRTGSYEKQTKYMFWWRNKKINLQLWHSYLERMTIAVDWDVKPQTKQNENVLAHFLLLHVAMYYNTLTMTYKYTLSAPLTLLSSMILLILLVLYRVKLELSDYR